MRNLLALLLVPCFATPALARPGFYLGLGIGGTTASGEVSNTADMKPDPGALAWAGSYPVTTDLDGGMSALFAMGFNVLGYGAVETRVTGHGHDLDAPSVRTWSAHWHTGVRAYPLWHWQQRLPVILQPLEPSLFVGYGMSYQGYAVDPDSEVAWTAGTGSMRLGAALEYFIISYFKAAIDYSWTRPSYDRFYYDYSDGDTYDVTPAPRTSFHQIYLLLSFQFGPPQEPVRYEARAEEQSPAHEPGITPRPEPAASEPEPATPAQPASAEGDDWI